MAELTSIQFVQMLQKCIGEYKKQMVQTRDESDACHYFNKSLLTFIRTHKPEFDILSTMNFEKPFMTWVKHYVN